MAPYQVQSRYNFLRGSDFDEIRVYDRMLDAPALAMLARHGDLAAAKPASAVAVEESARRAAGTTALAGTATRRRRNWSRRPPRSAMSASTT